ncbi:MAG: hypothetical protein STSR0009_09590 [Methanoregula sp.]
MKSMTKGYMPCERHVVMVIWYDVSRCLITDEEIIPGSASSGSVTIPMKYSMRSVKCKQQVETESGSEYTAFFP